MRSLFAAALIGLLAVVALADPASVQLDHAWSRAMPAGASGVVYLIITDRGEPDTLIGASSAVAAKAELHESFDDHGVMKMRPVASLSVAPDKPVKLAPGGYHIMLIGLKAEPGRRHWFSDNANLFESWSGFDDSSRGENRRSNAEHGPWQHGYAFVDRPAA